MSEQTPAPPSYGQATNPPQATAGAPPQPVMQPSAGAFPQPVMQSSAGALPQPVMQSSEQLLTAAAQPKVFWTVGPNGQPQMFYASAGIPPQPMPALAQPIPQAVAYIPPVAPAVQPVTGVLPLKLQPYSYLHFSLTVMIVCAILNITSLAFGIPALILSLKSEDKKRIGQYGKAKQSGARSLILTVINMTYTFFTVTLALALTLGLLYNHCQQDYFNCGGY